MVKLTRKAIKPEILCRNFRVLEGSLKSTSRQLVLVERDAEVVVVGAEDRVASNWSAIMRDNGGTALPVNLDP